jgi:nucleoside-diphosphate-sugar epimerase
MNTQDKIYIAGHRGMVGSAIERKLRKEGFNNIITNIVSITIVIIIITIFICYRLVLSLM